MLKKLLFVALLLITSFSLLADVYVRGHYRSNGSYVKPHYRSSPNNTKTDNWSTRGNVNPHTGKGGTRSLYGNTNNSRKKSLFDTSNSRSRSNSNSLFGR
jgi:hypothetical protein